MNACTTVADKIPVAGVDAITGHVKMWADKILEGREHPEHLFKVSLADGSTLEGVLHEDFRKGPLDLVGKCMDLERLQAIPGGAGPRKIQPIRSQKL